MNIEKSFLDDNGLQRLWQKITTTITKSLNGINGLYGVEQKVMTDMSYPGHGEVWKNLSSESIEYLFKYGSSNHIMLFNGDSILLGVTMGIVSKTDTNLVWYDYKNYIYNFETEDILEINITSLIKANINSIIPNFANKYTAVVQSGQGVAAYGGFIIPLYARARETSSSSESQYVNFAIKITKNGDCSLVNAPNTVYGLIGNGVSDAGTDSYILFKSGHTIGRLNSDLKLVYPSSSYPWGTANVGYIIEFGDMFLIVVYVSSGYQYYLTKDAATFTRITKIPLTSNPPITVYYDNLQSIGYILLNTTYPCCVYYKNGAWAIYDINSKLDSQYMFQSNMMYPSFGTAKGDLYAFIYDKDNRIGKYIRIREDNVEVLPYDNATTSWMFRHDTILDSINNWPIIQKIESFNAKISKTKQMPIPMRAKLQFHKNQIINLPDNLISLRIRNERNTILDFPCYNGKPISAAMSFGGIVLTNKERTSSSQTSNVNIKYSSLYPNIICNASGQDYEIEIVYESYAEK